MKNLRYILFTLVVIMSAFSCKKEDKNTHVSGKVIDGTTGASIANATINLKDVNEGKQIGSVTSDVNGNYSYYIQGEHSSLSFQVIYSDFYTSPWGNDFDLSLDETYERQNFNLNIYPPAYAKLIAVKNEAIYDGVTFIYTEHTLSGSMGIMVTNSIPTAFKYKIMKGGCTTEFRYNIQKNILGPPSSTIQTSSAANMYCAPRDTTDFYFIY